MAFRARLLSLLFPHRLTQWFGPLAATAAGVGVVALAVVSFGWLDLTASTPHPVGWANFLHFTFKRSVAHHAAEIDVPPEVYGNRLVRKGALIYAQECSHCHGAPGLAQNPVALSMRPTPQYLVAREDRFSPAELFWIVKHGVKYGAMPAWPAQSRDDEVWALVAFVNRVPRLSPSAYRAITSVDTRQPLDTDVKVAPFGGTATMSCAYCHGSDGRGRAGTGIPNISLLPREYMKAQLQAFASGRRPSGFMVQVAASLSDAQMDRYAAYYAAQPKQRSVAPDVDARVLARGEAIIAGRLPTTKAAACSSCHGQEGASPVGFSRLSGQHPAYLRDQLRLFRAGLRTTGPADQMTGAAHDLTDADIDAVSWAYAARQPR